MKREQRIRSWIRVCVAGALLLGIGALLTAERSDLLRVSRQLGATSVARIEKVPLKALNAHPAIVHILRYSQTHEPAGPHPDTAAPRTVLPNDGGSPAPSPQDDRIARAIERSRLLSQSRTPSTLPPEAFRSQWPRMRSQDEIAELAAEAGLQRNDAGKILIPGGRSGGLQLAFDPSLKDPFTGFDECSRNLMTCVLAGREEDECVAHVPRCQSKTPWLGDPTGVGCCPESCIRRYFAEPSKKARKGLKPIVNHSECYPGIQEWNEAHQRQFR